MDNEGPRFPPSDPPRHRSPMSGLQPLTTYIPTQNCTSGPSKIGVDRYSPSIIPLASNHTNPEHHLQDLPALRYVPDHSPAESPLQMQTIPIIIQSTSPVIICDSPETVGSCSIRYSNSTFSYSTDCTSPDSEDIENGIKGRVNIGSYAPTPTKMPTPSLDRDSMSDEYLPQVGYSQTNSRGSPRTNINSASSRSSEATSVRSSRSYAEEGSQENEEASPTGQDRCIVELFPFARARLDSLTYCRPNTLGENESSPENMRRQMLKVVFGWEQDIEELIRDELNRHPSNSMNAILLSKWLGDANANMASVFASRTQAPSNWMFLALSQMSGQTMPKELGWSLAQKMLKKGDIHVAAGILIDIGEHQDAIEMYTLHHYYMEAILLTCLEFPAAWHRQSALVRKWGEHLMMPSRQLLAMRCFSCEDMKSSEWTSLNAMTAEAFISYTQKLGLSIPQELPLQASWLVSAESSSSPTRTQTPAMSTTRITPQDLGPQITTSSAAPDSDQGRMLSHGATSGKQLATIFSGVTLNPEPAFSSQLASYMEEVDQHGDKERLSPCNYPSIRETSDEEQFPISIFPVAVPAPAKPTHHEKKNQRAVIKDGKNSRIATQGNSYDQSNTLSPPQRGTQLPDSASSHSERNRSVERGRTRHAFPLTDCPPLAPTSTSPEGFSRHYPDKPSRETLTSSQFQKMDPQNPSSKTCRPNAERPKARTGSEPAHYRRAQSSGQKRERRSASNERDTRVRHDRSVDRKRHGHRSDDRQPRENCAIRDEKDHQRRIGHQMHQNYRGLGITSFEEHSDSEKSMEGYIPAYGQSRSPSSPSNSSLQSSIRLTISTDSDLISICQDTGPLSAETQSTGRNGECADGGDQTSRPNSGLSAGESLPRRPDLAIHQAFYRNIRPSGSKSTPSLLAHRDPSVGRKPSFGDTPKPLNVESVSLPINEKVAKASGVADEPVSDHTPSRTNTPPSDHSDGQSLSEGAASKTMFRAMADRARSPSRGRRSESKRKEENAPTATVESPNISFKAMADRVRGLNRGRKDNGGMPIQVVQNSPYESIPAVPHPETPALA